MHIFLLNLKQKYFDEPFRTQKYIFRSELAHRNTVFLQIMTDIQQTANSVDKLILGKRTSLQFFLLDGAFESEIIVIAESMHLVVFYADLSLCIV